MNPAGTSRAAEDWFRQNKGRVLGWPAPLKDGTLLVSKGKAIFKPAGAPYVRSIRLNMGSKYPDGNVSHLADGRWTLRYYQENLAPGKRDAAWTNKALLQNMKDRVPFGVLEQVRRKPDSEYRVIGLGVAKAWHDGFFEIESWPLQTDSLSACPITGCAEPTVLAEAQLGGKTVRLRADLAALATAGLLAIRDGLVWVAPTVGEPSYRALHGKAVGGDGHREEGDPWETDPPWRSQG